MDDVSDSELKLVCTNCLREVPAEAKVCGYCGHRLKSESAIPSTPPDGEEPAVVAAAPKGERVRPADARGAVVAGIGLIAAASMPWFVGLGAGWSLSLLGGVAFNVDPAGVPLSFLSFGLVVFLLGAVAVLLGLGGRSRLVRRFLGVAAIGVAVFAVMTILPGSYDRALRLVEVGAWTVMLSGVVLLTGR
jgi:hypothetical protein